MAYLFCLSAFAQDQMVVRLNEQGLMKILQKVVEQKTADVKVRSFAIPKNLYAFSIPKAKLHANPIIPVINEISNFNMNQDLPFYLSTSEIKFLGTVDAKSLKVTIQNSGPKGFDVKISMNLPSVTVDAPRLSLCEDAVTRKKICGQGLKAEITNLKIKTVSRPVVLTAVLRLRTDNQVARFKVISVNSNLEAANGPVLDLNNFNLTIPKVALVINGQETELDTSRLYSEIKRREKFLSKKLLAFAADFVAEDVATLVNKYLVKQEVQTSWQILRGNGSKVTFNEFLNDRDLYDSHNLSGQSNQFPLAAVKTTKPKLIDTIVDKLVALLKASNLGIQTENVTIPMKNDIQVGASVNFELGNEAIFVRPYLANTNDREIPQIDLNAKRNSDINIALSEPLLNGFVDIVAASGFLDDVVREQLKLKGIQLGFINKVRVHISKRKSLIVVANLRIDLRKVETIGVGGWLENFAAQLLEMRRTHGQIFFPLQFELIPQVSRLADGRVELDMFIKSPFKDDCSENTATRSEGCGEILNEYNYPSNLDKMSGKVRTGVLSKVEKSLKDGVGKSYKIDITKFLNQSGVEFAPRNIAFEKEAYIILDVDVKNIKL